MPPAPFTVAIENGWNCIPFNSEQKRLPLRTREITWMATSTQNTLQDPHDVSVRQRSRNKSRGQAENTSPFSFVKKRMMAGSPLSACPPPFLLNAAERWPHARQPRSVFGIDESVHVCMIIAVIISCVRSKASRRRAARLAKSSTSISGDLNLILLKIIHHSALFI